MDVDQERKEGVDGDAAAGGGAAAAAGGASAGAAAAVAGPARHQRAPPQLKPFAMVPDDSKADFRDLFLGARRLP